MGESLPPGRCTIESSSTRRFPLRKNLPLSKFSAIVNCPLGLFLETAKRGIRIVTCFVSVRCSVHVWVFGASTTYEPSVSTAEGDAGHPLLFFRQTTNFSGVTVVVNRGMVRG